MSEQSSRDRHPRVILSIHDIEPLVDLLRHNNVDYERHLVPLEQAAGRGGNAADFGIQIRDYFLLLSQLSLATRDESLLLSKRRLLLGSTDFLVTSVGDANSLFGAMKKIAATNNLLHGGDYNRVEISDCRLDYIVDDKHFPFAFDHQQFRLLNMECGLIYICALLSVIAGDEVLSALRAVHTKRSRLTPPHNVLSCLKVPVQNDASRYVVRFDPAVAALPVNPPGADLLPTRQIAKKLLDLVDGRLLNAVNLVSIANKVEGLLEKGVCEQQDIAGCLTMSVATLKRRLRQENTSFRQLKEQVQNRAACKLLARDQDLGEIASLLGFSDVRSFSRAFKNWNGMTPSGYRKIVVEETLSPPFMSPGRVS